MSDLQTLVTRGRVRLFGVSRLFRGRLRLDRRLTRHIPIVTCRDARRRPRGGGHNFLKLFGGGRGPRPAAAAGLCALGQSIIGGRSRRGHELARATSDLTRHGCVVGARLGDLVTTVSRQIAASLQRERRRVVVAHRRAGI